MVRRRHFLTGTLTTVLATIMLTKATVADEAIPVRHRNRPMVATAEQLHSALMYRIDFAKLMLTKSGSFYPFGAALSQAGEVKAVGGWNGEEHPQSLEIYKLLADRFRSEATEGKISGAALAADVNIPAQYSPVWPDGLRVHLESPEYSRYIYVPYRVSKPGLFRNK